MAKGRKRTAKGRASEPRGAVSLATMGDMGATGPANRSRLVIEALVDIDSETGEVKPNPNGIKRARRVDFIEHLHRVGKLTSGAYAAASTLRNAYEGTLRAPGTDYSRPRVDSSPKPDHAVDIQTDRISRYLSISKMIAKPDRDIIMACVIDGMPPSSLRGADGHKLYAWSRFDAGIAELNSALERLYDKISRVQ